LVVVYVVLTRGSKKAPEIAQNLGESIGGFQAGIQIGKTKAEQRLREFQASLNPAAPASPPASKP
jgi:Sec-independent protein translocase protein TatA